MKPHPGPPATLGSTAAAGARIVVWCRGCGRRVEPDPAELANRYGADTPVREWHKRLVCSLRGPRDRFCADGSQEVRARDKQGLSTLIFGLFTRRHVQLDLGCAVGLAAMRAGTSSRPPLAG